MPGVFLSNANLQSANFTHADLFNSVLFGADLQDADFKFANLGGIVWDSKTNWQGVKVLDKAINVPIALKQQLGLE